MASYQDIVKLLDEAVGGASAPVGSHGAFWRGKTRDQFVAAVVYDEKLVSMGDGKNSKLIEALRGQDPFGSDVGVAGAEYRRMPAGRSAMPSQKVDIIEKWIDDNCPA